MAVWLLEVMVSIQAQNDRDRATYSRYLYAADYDLLTFSDDDLKLDWLRTIARDCDERGQLSVSAHCHQQID